MAAPAANLARGARRRDLLPVRRTAFLVIAACAGCREAPAQELPAARASAAPPSEVAAPAPPPSRCAGVRCASIERCDETTGLCAPSCPAGEVYIPATGPEGFVMGKGFLVDPEPSRVGKGHRAGTDRAHVVVLTKPFCMDEAEVTVAEMKACVDAGACRPPLRTARFPNWPDRLDHPANGVNHLEAVAYCRFRRKSLPTEAQWEWAATGGDGRQWPWGNDSPTCERADFVPGVLESPAGDSGCHGGGTSPVKTHPAGNKVWPTGSLYDLAGNVWEWCADTYAPYPGDKVIDPEVDQRDRGHRMYVVRGGGWNRSGFGIQSAFRGAAVETYQVPGLGLRCVRNPDPARP
jgi:formylglycine-generating enzyme required for sulfatase activity